MNKNYILYVVAVFLIGCSGPGPTQADREKIANLAAKFNMYDFRINYGMYLMVTAREGEHLTKDKAHQIFLLFREGSDGNFRQNTSIPYLNFYSSDKKFLFQLHSDTSGKAIEESDQAYY